MPFHWKKDKDTSKPISEEGRTLTEEVHAMYLEELKEDRLESAKISERAGQYEEAAGSYEAIAIDFGDEKLYDKARELRDRARGFQVKATSVDINELIKQLKENGGAIAYNCPSCGAGLKVNGKTESPDKCEYCGSKIENLPDVLKAILH
jgi:rubrerythrin